MEESTEVQLIQLVEAHPILYNKYEKLFKDSPSKEESWTKIALATGNTVEACQRVWRNIRERFGREMRMLKSLPPEERDTKQPSWSLFEHLTFLAPYIHHRKKLPFIKKSPSLRVDQVSAVVSQDPPPLVLLPMDTVDIKMVEEIMNTNTDPLEDSAETVARVDSTQVDRLSLIADKIQDVFNGLNNQTADDAFGRYVASCLKGMSKSAKNCAKRDILRVIETCENLD